MIERYNNVLLDIDDVSMIVFTDVGTDKNIRMSIAFKNGENCFYPISEQDKVAILNDATKSRDITISLID